MGYLSLHVLLGDSCHRLSAKVGSFARTRIYETDLTAVCVHIMPRHHEAYDVFSSGICKALPTAQPVI